MNWAINHPKHVCYEHRQCLVPWSTQWFAVFSLSPHPNVTKNGPQIQGGPTESNRHFSYIDFTDIHAVDQQPESVDATIRGSFTQPDQRLLTENSISKEDIDNIVFQGTWVHRKHFEQVWRGLLLEELVKDAQFCVNKLRGKKKDGKILQPYKWKWHTVTPAHQHNSKKRLGHS